MESEITRINKFTRGKNPVAISKVGERKPERRSNMQKASERVKREWERESGKRREAAGY